MTASKGKRAFGFCDRTGFRYKLTDLVPQIENQRWNGLLVGKDVVDVDQPQLQLGKISISDRLSLVCSDWVCSLSNPAGTGCLSCTDRLNLA